MRTPLQSSSIGAFALSLVCAVSNLVAADKDSTEGLTAAQILERMASTYGTCKSYRDSGVVTNHFGARPPEADRFPRHVAVKPFRTAFVRPDQFRFEYDDPTPAKAYIVWAKGNDVRTWWYVRPVVQKHTSLGDGTAGATGVSGGSAHTVPALLLPDLIAGRNLTAMTELKRLPDETLEETPCFKLEGKFANRPTTLWLEKATFLIRRIEYLSGAMKSTTAYSSQINVQILAEDLEFGAPTKP